MKMHNGRCARLFVRGVFLWAFLFMGPFPAAGAGEKWKEVLDCLRDDLGGMQGLTVPYDRLIFTSSTMLLGESEGEDPAAGRMHFQAPHFLKIAQEEPRTETVVADGKTLWWHVPEENRAYRYHA
jgi:outer membrane lipoprotein-sorting protein